jgi:Na+-driven multidrug efflux pump
VGVSAFVGEISSGVITLAFNMIILGLAGNTGVAAYGVVANTSLVAVSIFNGVSQGAQPLISEYYGKGQAKEVQTAVSLALATALMLAILILLGVTAGAEPIAALFNNEKDPALAAYAKTGLRLYFIGFLFAGINIVGTGIFSAVESAKWAFAASILRGFVLILFFVFFLSALFGMNGVWLSFPAAELATMAVTIVGLCNILQ